MQLSLELAATVYPAGDALEEPYFGIAGDFGLHLFPGCLAEKALAERRFVGKDVVLRLAVPCAQNGIGVDFSGAGTFELDD